MAEEIDYQRLRANTGDSEASLDDTAAEAIFVQAAELYSTDAIYSGTRVLRILELLGGAYKLHDYRANNSSESAAQIFDHLTTALSIWEGKVNTAIVAAGGSAARFGRSRRKPARTKEHPDGFGGEWWR